jgi:MoaA/NifB/PqqE/SkfB family radical SAM enzyme
VITIYTPIDVNSVENIISDTREDLKSMLTNLRSRDEEFTFHEEFPRVGNFSIVAGTEACNARCPFCVSKMTPPQGVTLKSQPIEWARFKMACEYAFKGKARTLMITGKGEPTLFPNEITEYLTKVRMYEEEFLHDVTNKELQTNAILIHDKGTEYETYLRLWGTLGLNLVAISNVHYNPEINRPIYTPYKKSYIDLPTAIRQIHEAGIRVRLAAVMISGGLDSVEEVEKYIEFGINNNVEQITMRPVTRPEESRDPAADAWIGERQLPYSAHLAISEYLDGIGTVEKELPYGGVVYNIGGQNVCLTNCLTRNYTEDYMRQLIFFPNGTIATDWTDERSVLE